LFYSIIYGDELFNEFNVVEIDDTIWEQLVEESSKPVEYLG
jgi:hypothetical protein